MGQELEWTVIQEPPADEEGGPYGGAGREGPSKIQALVEQVDLSEGGSEFEVAVQEVGDACLGDVPGQ